jgi:hypothetical protein
VVGERGAGRYYRYLAMRRAVLPNYWLSLPLAQGLHQVYRKRMELIPEPVVFFLSNFMQSGLSPWPSFRLMKVASIWICPPTCGRLV